MNRLDDQVAVVTGGAGDGIGKGISRAMARAGARVVILDVDRIRAEQAVNELMSEGAVHVSFVQADVSSEEQVEQAFEQIVRSHGKIDILVNGAGIGLVKAAHETAMDEFARLFAVDFQGVWLCCKFAISQMRKQRKGAIVTIGSVHGTATLPNYSLYAGAKAGLAGFTRGLAVQYGRDGIRANIVSPGLVDGSQTRAILNELGTDPQQWMDQFIERHQALPVAILAEDIGRAVAFLASDDARAITGIEVCVDAGVLAQLSSGD